MNMMRPLRSIACWRSSVSDRKPCCLQGLPSDRGCKSLGNTYGITSSIAKIRSHFSTQTGLAIAQSTSLSDNEDLDDSMAENKGFVDHKFKYSTREIFWRWGCSYTDISKIFQRRPSLRYADITKLQHKLKILEGFGITSCQLVKIINCRPRFLCSPINNCLDERVEYLIDLFGSRELFVKCIVRNSSLLTYNLHDRIKPVVDKYKEIGLSKNDLVFMLLSRPTIIPRTSLSSLKMEYIRRTGVSLDSKMFKYVVTLIAISRIETVREKLVNFEKFGFTEDEALRLCGRSPLILTFSVDKVQRNMTFILGTMKLQANVVLKYPFLLQFNLESVLKPRVLLAGKIQEMGLDPLIKGKAMFTALRMTEKRFVNAFISCHPRDVADELLTYYANAKSVKRLAVASKKRQSAGFPF